MTLLEIMGPRYFPAFEQHGYFEWKAKAAGQPISVRVTPAHFKEFVEHDTSFVKRDFPKVRGLEACEHPASWSLMRKHVYTAARVHMS